MTTLPQVPVSYVLEIVSDDERDPDPAEVNRVGQEVVMALRQEGWTITPTYTGQRGSVQLLFELVHQAVQVAHTVDADIVAHQAEIDVTAALCNIFLTIRPLLQRLLYPHQKAMSPGQTPTTNQQPTVTVTIDNIATTVTLPDTASDERIIQVAKQLQQEHPSMHVPPDGKVTIQKRVPKRPKRKNR
jgi:hypothetical protein